MSVPVAHRYLREEAVFGGFVYENTHGAHLLPDPGSLRVGLIHSSIITVGLHPTLSVSSTTGVISDDGEHGIAVQSRRMKGIIPPICSDEVGRAELSSCGCFV